jgi:lactoylglutathione lyase
VIERTFPILASPDLPRAIHFYVALLGGRLTYQFPETGTPDYVTIALGSSSLGLSASATAAPTSGRFELGAYTKDLDAAIERLRAAGVPILLEPEEQAWGERMARITDPDGNRVTLFED